MQLEYEIAQYLIDNKDSLKEKLNINKVNFFDHSSLFNACKDDYESALLAALRLELGHIFSPYSLLTEIINKEFVSKILGESFFNL